METEPRRMLPSKRCGDPDLLHRACIRLESLPVVNGPVRFDEKHNNGVGRVVVNLWCNAAHDKRERQPYVGLNSKPLTDAAAVPSYQVAVEKLFSARREQSCRLCGGGSGGTDGGSGSKLSS